MQANWGFATDKDEKQRCRMLEGSVGLCQLLRKCAWDRNQAGRSGGMQTESVVKDKFVWKLRLVSTLQYVSLTKPVAWSLQSVLPSY